MDMQESLLTGSESRHGSELCGRSIEDKVRENLSGRKQSTVDLVISIRQALALRLQRSALTESRKKK